MDYFEYVHKRNTIRAMERNQQVRREVVTRSLIGQQLALSTQPNAEPELLQTTASGNRERGANTIGDNVSVNASTLTNTPRTPILLRPPE